MDLPVMPPLKPMLAKAVARIPPGMQYEAKWDGFRALVFRDGREVELGSRTGKSLTRYFPELVAECTQQLPPRCVLDGEIVLARGPRLDFDALSERIHPAASRVRRLAEEQPAALVVFDLLAVGDTSALDLPQHERRRLLTEALHDVAPPLFPAPATDRLDLARRWFDRFEGAGLDGVVAKPPDGPYRPGERAMAKVKHERTAECVVGGLRRGKGSSPGALLLGLCSGESLEYVGVCSSFGAAKWREVTAELEPLAVPLAGHPWADWRDESAHEQRRLPGAPTRWNTEKSREWEPVRPERVCEVVYDHTQQGRFRHTTRFLRWRPDREPSSCTYEQLDEPVEFDVREVLAGGGT
ncbi:ATP-dependent DNA ligase [Streptomyces xiaopingdaonensis]|uniref:ATP-dependent DNA ligase n=1 Tax=Streptomyces xiaopingdaonensis TaxID=1565415 RepID=UPI0002D791D1|nr:ATP-dependent DNA ligase [Streptomyces xiaopingdaonensis]